MPGFAKEGASPHVREHSQTERRGAFCYGSYGPYT